VLATGATYSYFGHDEFAHLAPGLKSLADVESLRNHISETRRAVTTVNGATKLNVRTQLAIREGHVVLENVVDGNVRFIGGSLRATHNLAHNLAVTLKRSALPEQADLIPKQETGKMSK
jgi:hypothetical protein